MSEYGDRIYQLSLPSSEAVVPPRDIIWLKNEITSPRLNSRDCDSQPHVWSQSKVLFSYGPSLTTLAVAAAGRPLIYLCWGMPSQLDLWPLRALKLLRLKKILQGATSVLVNDEITEREVFALAGRRATLFPHVVDTDFFSFSPKRDREDFILVPGDNDRDERLVISLACAGFKVVRVTRDLARLKRNWTWSTARIDVKSDLSFQELRCLYRTAAAVALPITSSNHAAGQTSLLEAVSCGTPVVISRGKAATVARNYPSVAIASTQSVVEWASRLHEVVELEDAERLRASQLVARANDPTIVLGHLQLEIARAQDREKAHSP